MAGTIDSAGIVNVSIATAPRHPPHVPVRKPCAILKWKTRSMNASGRKASPRRGGRSDCLQMFAWRRGARAFGRDRPKECLDWKLVRLCPGQLGSECVLALVVALRTVLAACGWPDHVAIFFLFPRDRYDPSDPSRHRLGVAFKSVVDVDHLQRDRCGSCAAKQMDPLYSVEVQQKLRL